MYKHLPINPTTEKVLTTQTGLKINLISPNPLLPKTAQIAQNRTISFQHPQIQMHHLL